MSIRPFRFSRRLFLAESLALLTGCRSLSKLPPLPFGDRQTGEKTSLLEFDGAVTGIRTTSDWRYMAVHFQNRAPGAVEGISATTQNRILLYNIEFQTPLPCQEDQIEAIENPISVAFAPKTGICYIAQSGSAPDGTPQGGISVDRFEPAQKKKDPLPPFHLHDDAWIDAFLSPSADWLAVRCQDGHWEFRDLTADPVKEVCFPETYDSGSGARPVSVSRVLAVSPDGMLAAVLMNPSEKNGGGQSQTIAIWDLSTAHAIPPEKAKKLPLEALFVSEFHICDNAAGRICAFSPDGKIIAVRNKQKYVGIWQTASGKILSEFGEHRQPITAVQFTPNSAKLLVGTGENYGRLVLWDVRKGRLLRTYNDPEKESRRITAIQTSPDGNLVYFGNDRGKLGQWEYQSKPDAKKS